MTAKHSRKTPADAGSSWRNHRDSIIVLLVVTAAVVLSVIGSRYPVFRLFFAWPNGGTWSNTLAWLEDGGIALLLTWYFRNSAGKHLAKWWHKHQAEHLNKRDEQLRQHIANEMQALEQRLHWRLREHYADITSSAQQVNRNSQDNGK